MISPTAYGHREIQGLPKELNINTTEGRCCTARATERTISTPGMQSLYHVPQTKLKHCECPADLSLANMWQFIVVWNRSESWIKNQSRKTPIEFPSADQKDICIPKRRFLCLYFLLGMAFFRSDVGLREAIQQLQQQTSLGRNSGEFSEMLQKCH